MNYINSILAIIFTSTLLTSQQYLYQPVTHFLATDKPYTESTASPNNPWLDFYLTIRLKSPSDVDYYIPGHFIGNFSGGAHWAFTFCPTETGKWSLFIQRFRHASQINIETTKDWNSSIVNSAPAVTVGTPPSVVEDPINSYGSFTVIDYATPIYGVGEKPNLLKSGPVEIGDNGALKFHRSGQLYYKAGMNSPETLFGYKGFFKTRDYNNFDPGGNRYYYNEYSTYSSWWLLGEPNWETTIFSNPDGSSTTVDSNAGKPIIGLINYLESNEVNNVYFLPMNLGGDGQNCHPFLNTEDLSDPSWNDAAKRTYSTERLSQWLEVSKYMLQKNIFMDLVLAEEEDANGEFLDDSSGTRIGVTRKLFLKQMVAFFGWHSGIRYILSEENSPMAVRTQCNGQDSWDFTTAQLIEMGQYIKDCTISERDPLITVHTNPLGANPSACPGDPDYGLLVYEEILSHTNYSSNPFLNSASLQIELPNVRDHGYSYLISRCQEIFDNANQLVSIHFDEVGPANNGINIWQGNPINARSDFIWETFLNNAHQSGYIGSNYQDINFTSYSSYHEDYMECLKELRDFRYAFENIEFTQVNSSLINTVPARPEERSSLNFRTMSPPTMAKSSDSFYVIYYPVAFENVSGTYVERFGTIIDLLGHSTLDWHYSLRDASDPMTVIVSGSFTHTTTANKDLNTLFNLSSNFDHDYVLVLQLQ